MPRARYDSAAYVARYGFTPLTVVLLLMGCCAFLALWAWSPVDPTYREPVGYQWFIKIVGCLAFGSGTLMGLIMAVRGGEALVVDEDGITFVGSPVMPFGPRGRTVHYGWDDIAEVVIYEQYFRQTVTTLQFMSLGVRVQPHAVYAPRVHNFAGGMWFPDVADSVAHVPIDVLERSWAIAGWWLDEGRLREAVAHYAPDVSVVRLDRAGRRRRVRAL